MGCYTQRIICNSFHLALCEALCVPLQRTILLVVLVRELFQFFFVRSTPLSVVVLV